MHSMDRRNTTSPRGQGTGVNKTPRNHSELTDGRCAKAEGVVIPVQIPGNEFVTTGARAPSPHWAKERLTASARFGIRCPCVEH